MRFHVANAFFYAVYSSTAVRPLSEAELEELLRNSRANNQRLGVTGMLLYKDGRFMQALEGEETVVRTLLQKIAADPRHYDVRLLDEGFTEEREFSEWSMGFERLDGDGLEAPEGASDFLGRTDSARDFLEGGRAWRYLKLFRLVRA